MKHLTEQEKQAISVAIGYEVGRLLNLKFNKTGKTNTYYGNKTIEGLGACIEEIVKDQTERITN